MTQQNVNGAGAPTTHLHQEFVGSKKLTMTDLTTALARLKELGVEVPGEDAGRYLALTSDIEGEHKVTVVARGIADAAILELCAVVERQQRMLRLGVEWYCSIDNGPYWKIWPDDTRDDEVAKTLADLAARAEEE
jgi:hypothetical protein